MAKKHIEKAAKADGNTTMVKADTSGVVVKAGSVTTVAKRGSNVTISGMLIRGQDPYLQWVDRRKESAKFRDRAEYIASLIRADAKRAGELESDPEPDRLPPRNVHYKRARAKGASGAPATPGEPPAHA